MMKSKDRLNSLVLLGMQSILISQTLVANSTFFLAIPAAKMDISDDVSLYQLKKKNLVMIERVVLIL